MRLATTVRPARPTRRSASRPRQPRLRRPSHSASAVEVETVVTASLSSVAANSAIRRPHTSSTQTTACSARTVDLGIEQPSLGLEVLLEVPMEIQVVLRKIGERADVEADAVDASESKSVDWRPP